MWYDARTPADTNSGISDCGAPLIPVLHQCLYLRSTAQPRVPLESTKKGCVWSTSGSRTMRTFTDDELTYSEFWVLHTVPSGSHSSLSYFVWQSGEVVIQVEISEMVLPGDNECHSEHPCVNSSAFSTCLVSVHVSVSYSNTLLTVATNMLSFSWLLSTDFHYEWLSRLELFWFSSHAVTKWSSSQETGSLRPPREVDHLVYDWRIINILYHDFVFFAFRPGPILLQGLSTSVSSLNACSAVLNMRDMSSAKSRSVTVFAGTQWLTNFTRVNPSASSLPLMAHRST